jgi:hypothetical protein
MTTRTGKSILISRRAFATSLLASAALGIGVGELAGPLASSQAQAPAVAAKAPAACSQFAVNVGHAFTTLGTLLEDASKYPPLISQAAAAGIAKNTSKINAIAGQVSTINAAVKSQASKFQALKGPILKEETQCLS